MLTNHILSYVVAEAFIYRNKWKWIQFYLLFLRVCFFAGFLPEDNAENYSQ